MSRRCWIWLPTVLGAMAWMSTGTAQNASTLPDGLRQVPPDAMVFVHVRVGDLLKNDAFKSLLASLTKERDGLQILEKLDRELGIPLAELESATFVLMGPPRFGFGGKKAHKQADTPDTEYKKGEPVVPKASETERPRIEPKDDPKPDFKKEKTEPKTEPVEPKKDDKKLGALSQQSPVFSQEGPRGMQPYGYGHLHGYGPHLDMHEIEEMFGWEPMVILTSSKKLDRKHLLKKFARLDPRHDEYARGDVSIVFLSDRSCMLGRSGDLMRYSLHMGKTTDGTKSTSVSSALALGAKNKHLVVAGGHVPAPLKKLLTLQHGGRDIPAQLTPFTPFLNVSAGATLDLGKTLELNFEIQAPNERSASLAGEAGKSLLAALEVGLETLLQRPMADRPKFERAPPKADAQTQADLDRLFDFLAKDKNFIRVADLDRLRDQAAEFAKQRGLSDGKMTREQFAQFHESLRGKIVARGVAQEKSGLGDFIKKAARALSDAKFEQQGTTVRIKVSMDLDPATLTAAVNEIVAMIQQAGGRARHHNNLHQIGIAMHAYHDTYRGLPATAFGPIADKDGKPLLSWRVAVLPFIEQAPLFNQFRLNEPWDSAHNKKLIDKMPEIYALPGVPGKTGMTHYQVFVGGGAMFERERKTRFAEVADGLSNTLMVVEAAEPVLWTKPDDLPYDPQKPLPKLGGFYGPGFSAALGDGTVRFIPATVPEQVLRDLITRAGGEVVPADF